MFSTRIIRVCLPLLFLVAVTPIEAHAATRTWDNDSADGLWSTCANWSANTCPVSGDTASFTSSNTSNSTADASFTGTVGTLSIASGYTGTITVSRDLTLNTNGTALSQADGTLDFSSRTLTLNQNVGSITTTGGSVTGTNATTTFSANGGGSVTQTLTCTGTWPGVIDHTGNSNFTLASGCSATLARSITSPGAITLAGDATALSGSTLTMSDNNASLTITGSLTGLASLATTTFSANGGGSVTQTLTCTGTWPGSLTSTGSSNFTLASGCSAIASSTISKSGAITINGTLNILDKSITGGLLTVGSAGTLKLEGGQTSVTASTLSAGSTINYTGSGTYSKLVATSTYSNLIISGSGSFSTSTALTITGDFWQTAGTFTPSATTTFSGSTSATATTTSGTLFSNVAVNKSSATLTLGGNATTTGNFFITAGTVDASAANCSSASCSLAVGGNWSNIGTFTPRTGTVNLSGTNQSVIGNTTFYNFMKATTSVATTLTFAAGASQTVQNTLTLAGGSGNVLSLRSSTNGSAWDIDPQSNRSVAYLSVRDSNNTNGLAINATDGTSSGVSGNTGWDFGAPTVSSLGPTALVNGSYATDTTPTPTFTTADSDSNVAFQIQVGTDSSFSSNAVDYTSVYASPGSSSFTVGQAAGSGTYSTGSSGQTLSDASYYWRVRVGDGIATSSWSAANSGAMAFIVDATAPTTGSLTFSGVSQTSITITAGGASDSGSGISTYLFAESVISQMSTQSATNSWTLSGLTAGTTYSFVVGVTDAVGNVATSSAQTQATSPSSNNSQTAMGGWFANFVPSPPPPPSCALQFVPNIVKLHLPTMLSWSGVGVTSGSIDNIIGVVAPSGAKIITPPPPGVGQQKYTGVFITSTGTTVTCSATLTVQSNTGGNPTKKNPVVVPPLPTSTPPLPLPPTPPATTTPTTATSTPELPVATSTTPIIINNDAPITTSRDVPISLNVPVGGLSFVVFDTSNPNNALTVSDAHPAQFDLCGEQIYCSNGMYSLGAYYIREDGSHSGIETKNIELRDPYPLLTAAGEILNRDETKQAAKMGGVTVGGFGVLWAVVTGGYSASELPLLLWRSLMSLFLLGARFRRDRRWGTVYDNKTKRPLDPAIVTLYQTDSTEVRTAITDLDGRYGFLVDKGGTFYLKAQKSHHLFPASDTLIDPLYPSPYRGEPLVIPDGGGVIVRDIPLEPTDFDWNEEQKYAHDLYQFFSRVDRPLAYLSFALVPTGFLTSLWSVIVSPVPINIAFVAAYFLLGLLFMGGLGPRLYGFVKTRVGTPLPFARLEAHRPGSPVIAGCAIADHFGRYYLLLPKGDFVLTIVLSRGEPGDATIVDEREIHTRGYYSRDVVIKDQST